MSLAQIGLFVLLGLLASPARLPEAIGPALVAGFVLTFVARPISILFCATPFGLGLREQVFLSWAGLRGAVPIVLTTVPIVAGVGGALEVFDIVFLLVVVYTLLQGPTLPRAARLTGVDAELPRSEVQVESAPLEEVRADLLEVTVTADSRLVGVWVIDLRLPVGAEVVLIVRDGHPRVPDPHAVLRSGDRVLIVSTRQVRSAVEARLLAVARAGRLAGWIEPGGTRPAPADVGT